MYIRHGNMFRCSGECNWLCETRCVYIRSCNKMAELGYAYTLEKQTSRSPEHCTNRNATSAEFLEERIL